MFSPLFYFLIRLVALTVVFVVAGYLLQSHFPEYYTPVFYPVLVFFFFITLLVHIVLLRASRKKESFPSWFMGAITVKLLASFTFVLVYAYSGRTDVLPFVFTFFLIYMVYTIFEIVIILKHIKGKHS